VAAAPYLAEHRMHVFFCSLHPLFFMASCWLYLRLVFAAVFFSSLESLSFSGPFFKLWAFFLRSFSVCAYHGV